MRRILCCTAAAFLTSTLPVFAQDADDYAKLGPNAISIATDTDYLRASPAPDYWAFSPFTKPQFTTSACSIATVTAAINGIKGQPEWASQTILRQPELLELTASAEWSSLSAEGGDGVKFQQLADFTSLALSATELDRTTTVFHPRAADDAARIEMMQMLTDNEATADNAIMVYFNQGVVTGDWDGPHISLIGAYDAAQERVLILEVDQEWYIPYWTSVDVLLEAIVKPTSAEHGPLEGETGGFVMINAAK